LFPVHGRPRIFRDWSKVIPPLADPAKSGGDPGDAFEVSVPSLPRFSFSTPLTSGKENSVSTADPFHTLMTGVPSYDKLAVDASDYRALTGTPARLQVRGLPLPRQFGATARELLLVSGNSSRAASHSARVPVL
jgi:hypothetical protein